MNSTINKKLNLDLGHVFASPGVALFQRARIHAHAQRRLVLPQALDP